ncbi:MAG: hypothetical protein HYR94_24840 [Chloroflexi bacterium]|nr:hypothetical protein [Chloroflexota bacterium]
MYLSIRRYEGVDPASVDEIFQLVEEGFVPIISEGSGFIAFYALDAENGVLASISIFENQAEAKQSNRLAAVWVQENLAHLLPQPPQITAGELRVHKALVAGRKVMTRV